MNDTLVKWALLGALAALAACGPGRSTWDTGTPGADAAMDVVDVREAAACRAPEMLCGGACANVQTDRANCGMCGNACPTGQFCVSGMCQTQCPTGQTPCNGRCVTLATDSENCGMCGNACAAGEVCNASRCGRECAAGFTLCTPRPDPDAGVTDAGAPVCTDIQNDPANCGGCRRTCALGEICVAGRCQTNCPAGQTACAMTCVDTNTDPNHCGGCGMTCAGSCVGGVCMPRCPTGQTACGGTCVDTQTSRAHCGGCGMACGSGQVCTMGRCVTTCAMGTTACGTRCADLTTDRLNCGACGNACASTQVCSGGMCQGSCGTGQTNCGGVCTNTAFDPANCGGCGVACGMGFACVMGACRPLEGTDAGPCNAPSLMCGTSCVDPRSDNLNCGMCGRACAADRTCVMGMCVAPCAAGQMRCGTTCTNVTTDRNNCGACGNVCGTGLSCVGGACVAEPTFRITSLGTTGCSTIEHASITGDDHGGIAVSSSHVFYNGDTSTGRFSAADLTGGAAVGVIHDGITNDLATGTVYVLLTAGGTEPSGSGTVTQLGVIDGMTGMLTATRIPLSSSITVTSSTGIFGGYGRMLIHNGSQWFHIRLPSGQVTPLRMAGTPTHSFCETWAYWGIAEYFGGEYYAVYVENSSRIVRYRVSDGMISTVGTFSNLSDMCSISFSPMRNRWYWHHEGTSQFSTGFPDESIGFCPAMYDSP